MHMKYNFPIIGRRQHVPDPSRHPGLRAALRRRRRLHHADRGKEEVEALRAKEQLRETSKVQYG